MFLRALLERSRCENWISWRTTFFSCLPATLALPAAHAASAASLRSFAICAVLSSFDRCLPRRDSASTVATSAASRQLSDPNEAPTGVAAQSSGSVVVVLVVGTALVVVAFVVVVVLVVVTVVVEVLVVAASV